MRTSSLPRATRNAAGITRGASAATRPGQRSANSAVGGTVDWASAANTDVTTIARAAVIIRKTWLTTTMQPSALAHVPAKPALGLDPRVDTGSPTRTCATLINLEHVPDSNGTGHALGQGDFWRAGISHGF